MMAFLLTIFMALALHYGAGLGLAFGVLGMVQYVVLGGVL